MKVITVGVYILETSDDNLNENFTATGDEVLFQKDPRRKLFPSVRKIKVAPHVRKIKAMMKSR
jgi:hypothetical protein